MPFSKRNLPKDREEAIENLICAAIRISYPSNQIPWSSDKSLVETKFVFDLKMCLKELEKFNK